MAVIVGKTNGGIMATSELLNPEPEQQPKPPNRKATPPAMKNETSAQKYKRAYDECWARLPKWKQIAIEGDRRMNVLDSHISNEFAHTVVEYYETL